MANDGRTFRVGISGSYGGMNLGDEAILEGTALRGTPFAPLPYASKVSGLLEDLGMDTPPLESIGIGQLIGRIDRKWDARESIRERASEHVPALRARAKLSNAALLRALARV